MRLVGRWLGALIGLSVCLTCLMLLRLSHDTSVNQAALSPRPNPPTASQWTRQTLQRILQSMTPPMTSTAATATPTPTTPTTTPKPTTTTSQQQRQQKMEDDEQREYRRLCWKSGYSPASGRPTNHTPGDFLINESRVCSGHLLLLVIVHSEIRNRPRRDLTRRTWASLNSVNGHRLAVVFVVGSTGDARQEAALREESAEAADLVQVPCRPDGDPHVSACKALYSLLWVSRHCPGAEFLLKVDDHVFVNVFHVAALVTGRLAGASNTFYCRTAANEGRISIKGYMWYVSPEEWPAAVYPTHCKGLAYLMSVDLAPRLLRCAAWRNFMSLEDIYITGVLGQALNVRMVHWTNGWDADWLHPKHDGPAVASAIVLVSPDGAPLPSLHMRVWKAALVYSADFI